MTLRDLIQRLKAGLAKAKNRIQARTEEEALSRRKTKRLNKEIKELREKLKSFIASHQKAKESLENTADPRRAEELRKAIGQQEAAIDELIHKIDRKVGKRKAWRRKARRAQKRAAWWIKRKTTLRSKLKEAEAKWEKEHKLDFQTWMLNGCPGDVTDDIKEIIAYVVVVCGQYVTATTNGVHTTGSYHYQHRAVDWGQSTVSSMQDAANKTRAHFGDSHFTEFFSPCPWWIKYGSVYSGYFPGHGDHGHCAV